MGGGEGVWGGLGCFCFLLLFVCLFFVCLFVCLFYFTPAHCVARVNSDVFLAFSGFLLSAS